MFPQLFSFEFISLSLGLSFHHWMLPFFDLISFTIHIKAMIHILDVKFPLFVNSNKKKIVLFACAAYHLQSSYMTQYHTMTLNTPNDDIQQRIICLCDLYRIVLSFRQTFFLPRYMENIFAINIDDDTIATTNILISHSKSIDGFK